MNLEKAVAYLRDHEGCCEHMYLDTAGLVTIGVGIMLPTAESAMALRMVKRDGGELAGQYEKAAEWQAVHAQKPGHLASAYKEFTRLVLPEVEIESELLTRVSGFTANLRQRFPGFDEFPDAAQLGLLDEIFNLGARGLFRGFPKFCAAVDAGDWKGAAAESGRKGVGDERNVDLAELFKQAAQVNA